MARPKKERVWQGHLLPENLYPDPRGRPNYWRYRREPGSEPLYKTFEAPAEQAIKWANEANALRLTSLDGARPLTLTRDSINLHIDRYIEWRKANDERLHTKDSWKNRQGHLRNFSNDFSHIPIHQLSLKNLRKWWENLTYHQQHARRAEFNKLFSYLMAEGLCPKLEFNPFTTADDRPRLLEKGKTASKRMRLTVENFWKIYKRAGEEGYEGLQIAMGISLITTMRRSDICELRFDENITNNILQKTINKSAEQREAIYASHLSWDLTRHATLSQLIKRARELSLRNGRCPYVISHRPLQRRLGKLKTHVCQVIPDRLSDMFKEIRDLTGLYKMLPQNKKPPSFHEIRSLASIQYKRQGYNTSQVQKLMAHTDEKVTLGYQAGHEIEYTQVELYLDEAVIGGHF